jgi:hypothetical protein
MSERKNPVDRLNEMLGYDSSRPANPTADLFQEIQDEMTEERQLEAKKKARALLTEAVKLNTEFQNAKRQFAKQEEKFMKELGKLMNRIESAARGATGEAPEEAVTETPAGDPAEAEV